MKLTNKTTNGISFHGSTVKTTPRNLIEKVGKPQYDGNDGQDKVNFVWDCENSLGNIFTIYDWKEYRVLNLDESIEFHIGGHSKKDTELVKQELEKILND
jgi:hypothetical protein